MTRRARPQRSGVIGFATRWFRRIRRLAMVASVAAAGYRWWQRRQGGGGEGGGGGGTRRRAPTGGPNTPSPLRATVTPEDELAPAGAAGPAAVTVAAPTRTTARGAGRRAAWVAPLASGACPTTHPVKANEQSGIFHLPGGRFYERTGAARCYTDPDSASADGYRASKA